jgi:hypothetical protein
MTPGMLAIIYCRFLRLVICRIAVFFCPHLNIQEQQLTVVPKQKPKTNIDGNWLKQSKVLIIIGLPTNVHVIEAGRRRVM